MNPLEGLLEGTNQALEEVGMPDVAEALRKIGTLEGRHKLERAVLVLNGLGPELVKAYVRAGAFAKGAAPSVRADAVKYQGDLFTARCYVAALREAARRTLKGDYALN